ncbi:MAG: hypothetical protein HY211_06575 [Candidatus Omnitrophica bacterium]|nr:hypothetical protein [Candidatus Omnitrophota bacterium]
MSFSYNWILVAFLAVIGICQVLTLLTLLIAVRHWLQTSRKADQTLELTRQLITRANRSAEEVEGVLHQACGVVSKTVEQFNFLKSRVQTFWTQQFGNGHRGRFHRQYKMGKP